MDGVRLREILSDVTCILKGQEMIDRREARSLRVVQLFEALPVEKVMALVESVPESSVAIGVYTRRAQEARDELLSALGGIAKHSTQLERPATYLELAQRLTIEDELAVCLLALGTHLDLWTVKRFRPAEMIAAGILAIATIDVEVPVLTALFT